MTLSHTFESSQAPHGYRVDTFYPGDAILHHFGVKRDITRSRNNRISVKGKIERGEMGMFYRPYSFFE